MKKQIREYLLANIAIGVCFGITLGVVFNNYLTGIVLGICLGIGRTIILFFNN